MLRRKPARLLFIFPQAARHPIHALFVFFPFTAVFLDEKKRVVHVQNVNPFSLYAAPPEPAKFLLELPASKNPPTKKGDRMDWNCA